MPRKIRQLIDDLERNGFVNKSGGKGSHQKFIHPGYPFVVILSGQSGADAKKYQEKAVKLAIKGVKK